jgi:hypothetical protein
MKLIVGIVIVGLAAMGGLIFMFASAGRSQAVVVAPVATLPAYPAYDGKVISINNEEDWAKVMFYANDLNKHIIFDFTGSDW